MFDPDDVFTYELCFFGVLREAERLGRGGQPYKYYGR